MSFRTLRQASWAQHRTLLRLSSVRSWCLCLGFILIAALFLDRPIIHLASLSPQWVHQLGHGLGLFGKSQYPIVGGAVIAIALTLLAYSFRPGQGRKICWSFVQLAAFTSLATVWSGVVVLLAKRLIGRPRPIKWLEDGLYEWLPLQFQHLYVSMPSGHTATVFTLAFILCVFAPKARWWILSLASIIVLGRVLALQHWPSDVVVGAVVGWVLGRVAANVLVGPTRLFSKQENGDVVVSETWTANVKAFRGYLRHTFSFS